MHAINGLVVNSMVFVCIHYDSFTLVETTASHAREAAKNTSNKRQTGADDNPGDRGFAEETSPDRIDR